MEVKLLGPVRLRAAEADVDLGPPLQRLTFAALALDAGRPVRPDALIDRLWGQASPQRARDSLYVHIARLRTVLDPVPDLRLARRSGGYLLDIDPLRVDVHRFESLLASARGGASAPQRRAALLGECLALWRGEPLADLGGEWIGQVRQALRAKHFDAVQLWAEAQLELGDPARTIGPLADLLAAQPFAESLAGLLMRALAASGRTAEALEHYTAMRTRLAEELGSDPSQELQEVHREVLRGGRRVSAPAPPMAARAAPVPAQLPMDVRWFIGRDWELKQLNEVAVDGAAPLVVITGTAGVGKTALALHWAHQVADRFPDGQLYVNLRGFAPSGSPMSPAEAIRGFLDALAISPERIPTGLDAQAALYRTLLSGKRVLVIVDNARDADQVRSLLPGAPGSLALVTSRNQLTSLVAVEGAHPVSLDMLSQDEARQLLTRRLGNRRATAEPAAIDAMITQSARLPLALSIVAARAATRPESSLASLAGQMQARDRLDTLHAGDPITDLRAVFSWSYNALGSEEARLFRHLGLHPGPDITTPSVASLIGTTLGHAQRLLNELQLAHLITEPTPGRYVPHDLLRSYAIDLVHAVDSDDDRHAARQRLLDHYLRTAYDGVLLLYEHQHLITLVPAQPGAAPEPLADDRHALAWFAAERQVLLAAVDQAATQGLDAYAWQLAWTLEHYFGRRGHWQDWAAVQNTALDAARRMADPTGQAHAHYGLARAYTRLGRYDDAHTHFLHALDRFGEVGDRIGQAISHRNRGFVFDRQGRHEEALTQATQAFELYRAAGHRAGQANALNNVGWCHAQLGDYRQALVHCRQALALHQELGNRYGEAATLDSLGYAYHQLGEHQKAIICFRDTLGLARDLGDRYHEAVTLVHIGETTHAAGDPDGGRAALQSAMDILDELEHPDADSVRLKLQQLC